MMQAYVGGWCRPDGWQWGSILKDGDSSCDGYAGSQFKVCGVESDYPVNVSITGRVCRPDGTIRCKIEFVRDGEPSDFCGGYCEVIEA